MDFGTRDCESAPAAQAAHEAHEAADMLLHKTRRTALMTLEAAMAKARPFRPDRRRMSADALEAAQDLMTLSRLAMQSADRLNGVAGSLVGCGNASGVSGFAH